MRWTEDTTLKFVELYEENECLWNVSSIHYRNKQMRDSAIKKIVDEMNIEGFGPQDVKNKIKNLRTTYSQERNKVEKHRKSGSGTDDVYIPAMKWFDIMNRFMKNVEAKRSSKSNLADSQDINSQINDKASSENSSSVTNNTNLQIDENASVVQNNNIVETPKNNGNKPTKTTTSTSKKRKLQDVRTAVEELKQLNSTLMQPQPEESEYELFGKYIAVHLKQLLPEDSLLAQQEIQSILTRYRVQSLKRMRSENRMQSENRVQVSECETQDSLSSVHSFGTSAVSPYSLIQNQSEVECANDIIVRAFSNSFA